MKGAAAMDFSVPKISGDYMHVYQPAGDVFPGPSIPPLEAGRRYEDWVANDHCFVKDDQGRWHAFGITHPESGLENVHAGEWQSFHAVAPKGTLKDVMRAGAWKDEPKILPPAERPGEIPENHAPCIERIDGVYKMIYGPTPLRVATSTDLYRWTPRGPLVNSLITRDPNLFRWNDTWHILTCGNFEVRMATLTDFSTCGESRIIMHAKEGVAPESPTLLRHAGTFYLFVCDFDGVWDKKDIQGAYQHITRVYQSDDPYHFDAAREIAQLHAHAPEIFQGEDGEWYISSAEWPHRGVSIAPLTWEKQ
jgi:beta-fructofuranosidase